MVSKNNEKLIDLLYERNIEKDDAIGIVVFAKDEPYCQQIIDYMGEHPNASGEELLEKVVEIIPKQEFEIER